MEDMYRDAQFIIVHRLHTLTSGEATDLELKEADRLPEAVTATPPRSNSPSSLATSAQSQDVYAWPVA